MFCGKCGQEVPNGAKFCPKCGEQMIHIGGQEKKISIPKKKNAKNVRILIACIIAAAVICCLAAGSRLLNRSDVSKLTGEWKVTEAGDGWDHFDGAVFMISEPDVKGGTFGTVDIRVHDEDSTDRYTGYYEVNGDSKMIILTVGDDNPLIYPTDEISFCYEFEGRNRIIFAPVGENTDKALKLKRSNGSF